MEQLFVVVVTNVTQRKRSAKNALFVASSQPLYKILQANFLFTCLHKVHVAAVHFENDQTQNRKWCKIFRIQPDQMRDLVWRIGTGLILGHIGLGLQ